jgi:rod shape-determining protein MreC
MARFVFFVTLSLTLTVLDLRLNYLEVVRQTIGVVTYPLQQAAFAPAQAARSVGRYFSTVDALHQDNDRMKRQQTELAGVSLRQQQLEQENQRLRSLLEMKQRQPAKGIVAEIVYAARDPFSHKVFIDKGSHQGIVPGAAVVDERGVIGQVTRVMPLQSEVTLISDKNQAVPVQVARNGLRAVMFGSEIGLLELRFLAANADVQSGDVVVTSGLDEIFLPGLPVGKVLRVERDNVYAFARILCQAIGGVGQYGVVLVLGPPEKPLRPAVPESEGVSKTSRRGSGAGNSSPH